MRIVDNWEKGHHKFCRTVATWRKLPCLEALKWLETSPRLQLSVISIAHLSCLPPFPSSSLHRCNDKSFSLMSSSWTIAVECEWWLVGKLAKRRQLHPPSGGRAQHPLYFSNWCESNRWLSVTLNIIASFSNSISVMTLWIMIKMLLLNINIVARFGHKFW